MTKTEQDLLNYEAI